ncbi:MAG: SDR family NAD(P)-dependent oxidoreductase [Chloroflexi bacterium]|nr:MAG: SDR family NAD(P)-dependent oxidoreductase [Chloroflexota bacterium]
MILVVGATGVLGTAICKRLLESGEQVRAMTRTPDNAANLKTAGAEIVLGDLCDPASLRRACAGVEKVVASAHSIMGRGREASKYVDGLGHKDLIDAAKEAGCRHFVYVSLEGVESNPTPFAHFKHEVERYLKASGLSFTILRPTAFMETHAHAMLGQSILETGKATLFGQGNAPRNFVTVVDVAEYALIALFDDKAKGQTIEIGTPENWTNREVAELYENLSGREAKISHVPRGMLRVMSVLLRPFHPGLSQVMQFSLWTDTTNPTFDASETLKEYPVQLTNLEDWVRQQVQVDVPAHEG